MIPGAVARWEAQWAALKEEYARRLAEDGAADEEYLWAGGKPVYGLRAW